jgi:hypothetical protein
MFRSGKRRQRKAMKRGRSWIRWPVGRVVRGDQEDRIEVQRSSRGFSRVDMAEVDRIERAAKHSKPPDRHAS